MKMFHSIRHAMKVRNLQINIQSKILILGNGGLKHSTTYQEDDFLNKCVQTLQKIDIEIKQLEKKKIIRISGTKLLGTLHFEIDE